MSNVQLRQSERWTAAFTPHPQFDKAGFQKKIDEICGMNIVRLVWGAEEETTEAVTVGHFGEVLETKRVGRYQTRIKGSPRKVRVNRWILEQFYAPEILNIENMFVRMPGKSGLYVPPELARMKKEGLWKPFQYLCDHSKCSAEQQCNDPHSDYYCFGDYCEPGEVDLNALREQMREKLAQKNRFIAIGTEESAFVD